MRPHHKIAHRAPRRRQREQGAVLFLVLMIVAFSSLAATFAVQDTSYALSASRAAKEHAMARYAAESGVNAAPAYVAAGDEEANALLRSEADAGADAGSERHRRLHLPQPQGDPPMVFFDDSEGPSGALRKHMRNTQNASLPRQLLFETIVDVDTGGSTGLVNYTVSSYGRVTSRWNSATGAYDSPTVGDVQQANDENWYHEVVSVSRGYGAK